MDLHAGAPKTAVTSPASIPRSESVPFVSRIHIPSVGWCVRTSADVYEMLLADGTTVLVDIGRNAAAYGTGTGGPLTWHAIDAQMPADLRARIGYLPAFMSRMQASHQ